MSGEHESDAVADERSRLSDSPWVRELKEDLGRLGLEGELCALVLKDETAEVISLGPPVIVIPISVLGSGLTGGGLTHEIIALGLSQSVEQIRAGGPTALLGETLLALARATRPYDSPENGLLLILEAIGVLRDVGARHRLARAYVDLGENLNDGGAQYDALRAFELAGEAASETGDEGALAASLYNRAVICRGLRLETEALLLLDKSFDALPKVNMASGWIEQITSERVLNRLALEQDQNALEAIDEWLARSAGHYAPYLYRGDIRSRSDGATAALDDYCTAALCAADEIRGNISGRFRRIDRQRLDIVFEKAVGCALEAENLELAFGLVELSRSGAGVLTVAKKEDESEINTKALERLREDARELVAASVEALADRDAEKLRLGQERADWLIAQRDLLRLGKLPEIEREQVESWAARVQSALAEDTALLEFGVIGSRVIRFALTRERVEARVLDLGHAELSLLAEGFSQECAGLFPSDALDVLARELIAPVSDVLQSIASVVVVPALGLYGVPFHAMPLDGAPLVESRRVAYADRAQDLVDRADGLVRPIDRTARWRGIGVPSVGYADLPELSGVREELEKAARRFADSSVALEPPATSADLLGDESGCEVLHVACHGDFEPSAPLLSSLMLADRPVFAFELMLSELSADLVVLSACETGQARAALGGHTQSLASAFVRAGARHVIAAQWPVDDESGSACIDRFYDTQLEDGAASPAESLRVAQCSLRAEREPPYFWAPFSVVGVEGRGAS